MPSSSKFSKIKNIIMGYVCLKLIELNQWKKALRLYKSYPELDLNVESRDGHSLIEILILPKMPEDFKDNKFRDELLTLVIRSFKDEKNDDLLKYGLMGSYHFANVDMSSSLIISRIFCHSPHLAPHLFEALSLSPNKNAFLACMLNFSFELDNINLMRLAVKYYTEEKSLPFPSSTLLLYFTLVNPHRQLLIGIDEFVDNFKDKGIDYASFIIKNEFYFPGSYLDETFLTGAGDEGAKITNGIMAYYKKLNSLGFTPTSTDLVEAGEPINLLERCFLKGQYLSVLPLAQVYPNIFCTPEKIVQLKSWIKAREEDYSCALHPDFPTKYMIPISSNPKAFDFMKNGLEAVFQKIELEKSVKFAPISVAVKPLKV